MTRTLVDNTGFKERLKESTFDEIPQAPLNKALVNAKLAVMENLDGEQYLVHRDGAYVKAAISNNMIRLTKDENSASIPVISSRLEDDFISAFRYVWLS